MGWIVRRIRGLIRFWRLGLTRRGGFSLLDVSGKRVTNTGIEGNNDPDAKFIADMRVMDLFMR